MNEKKLLIIAYYFPPIKAVGSLRSYYFAKNLLGRGWNISIITTKYFKYLQNDSFLSKLREVKYNYLPSFDLHMIKTILSSKSNLNKNNKPNLKPTAKKSISKKVRSSFPLNIMYEGGFIYIIFGFLFGLYYVKKNNIKYIYSTFSPYSNHIIAYLIKLIYKDIFWVADFRDLPFGENDTEIFFKSFQCKMNSIICKKANAITTISSGMKNSLLKYNNNIHVITNGFDMKIEELIQKKLPKPKEFNIVYTGMLYQGQRDASIIFKTVRKLLDDKKLPENLKLVYAGKDSNLWKQWSIEYNLEHYIDIKGIITRKEASLLQGSASINLMLTWATKNEKGILTGKLFEYLSTLNPIVCIINGVKDMEIENIFTSLNCGGVFYTDEVDKVYDAIKNIYINDKVQYNLKELEKYSYSYLSNRLEKIYLTDDIV